ncbi:MAG: hydrogenase maturation protease [Armatimonadota bacterium]|nr:hydrogenase maturation protease [Armatimonadota bacterium]MDR7519068.1 hydrogenase maturation protease [Armatimonadota bacterium]
MRRAVLIVGVGTTDHGDDAAGLAVARRVGVLLAEPARRGIRDAVTVVEHTGDAAALMEAWAGAQAVILVDAVVSGAPPGTICRLDLGAVTIPSLRHPSTHAFGIAEAVGLARALGRGPSCAVLYGIEAASCSPGHGMSAPVASAVETAARRVLEEALDLAEAADGQSRVGERGVGPTV